VLLTSGSPWQRALADRLATEESLRLVGIVIQSKPKSMRWDRVTRTFLRRPGLPGKKIITRLVLGRVIKEIAAAELEWFGESGQALEWPDVPLLGVQDINANEVVTFLENQEPDIGAVSGTRMIKAPIFAVNPPDGLLNLHTGLSPYLKGGPNCTLWALSGQQPELIGATIHVLDPGIDSGDILLTEFTPLESTDTLGRAVSRTVAHGHEMYLRVLRAIAKGEPVAGVRQAELGEGRTYFNREWGPVHLWRASRFVGQGGLARWIGEGCPRDPGVRLVNALGG
jgi:folate-dependent phosphoribosylglycinamide formyltransferase PurN